MSKKYKKNGNNNQGTTTFLNKQKNCNFFEKANKQI